MHKFLYLSFATAVIFGLGVVSGNLFHHPRQPQVESQTPESAAVAESDAKADAVLVAQSQDAQSQDVPMPAVPAPIAESAVGAESSSALPQHIGDAEAPLPDPVNTAAFFTLEQSPIDEPPIADTPDSILQTAYHNETLMASESVAANASAAVSSAEAQSIIREYFPDVDPPTLDGWMDSYDGLTRDDLHGVMQQRALLGNQLSTLDLQLPSLTAMDLPTTETDHTNPTPEPSPAAQVVATATSNLQHLMTVGFRRTIVRTEIASISADTSPTDTVVTQHFDLSEGRRQTSRSPLHVAIASGEDCMFVLEQDNLLTRNGQFQLADDGRLGLRSGAAFTAVCGPSAIPPGATSVQIAEDGTVHYQDLEGEPATAGAISLVRIHAPQSLQSANGVYFRLGVEQGDTEAVAGPQLSVVEQPRLDLQTVELSNVHEDQEQALIAHFGRLAEPNEPRTPAIEKSMSSGVQRP